ncbi:DUF4230 domain-containing protein [uncultured Sphingomonas sp.]|uniref:DUF4230 domain-containing protein n=1 Tax=uncultured Sphingomonas sp. TaxID=158754 RepID=UPI0025FBBC91|nr:DUF4230 domain-containing protein [uncultured Sphingomonas sp.]
MGDRLNPKQLIGAAVALSLLIVAAFVGKALYDRVSDSYVVERKDDGSAVTKVVRATFTRASSLKVGSLSGNVQATASDTRLGGMLTSDRVVKAPFSVDYFVDVSRLRDRDYRYDPATRTLVIDAPDVTIGAVNVDEARRTLSETRGVFVTRDAMDTLSQRASASAQASAEAEAKKPERIAQARDNARRTLAQLLAGPLEAAGVADPRILVTFPYERGSRQDWDRTKTVEQVLGNRS